MIIPLIQLFGGEVVQLIDQEVRLRETDTWAVADKFSLFTEVQIIDLDGALKKGDNSELIKKMCGVLNARVGGGIRSFSKAEEYIDAGAKKIIIGTKAKVEFMENLCKEIGKENVIVALDAISGNIAIEGWRKKTNKPIYDAVVDLKDYCAEFLYTSIGHEKGHLEKDINTIAELRSWTNNKISVALGDATMGEITQLDELGVNSVVGLPLYTGEIPSDIL